MDQNNEDKSDVNLQRNLRTTFCEQNRGRNSKSELHGHIKERKEVINCCACVTTSEKEDEGSVSSCRESGQSSICDEKNDDVFENENAIHIRISQSKSENANRFHREPETIKFRSFSSSHVDSTSLPVATSLRVKSRSRLSLDSVRTEDINFIKSNKQKLYNKVRDTLFKRRKRHETHNVPVAFIFPPQLGHTTYRGSTTFGEKTTDRRRESCPKGMNHHQRLSRSLAVPLPTDEYLWVSRNVRNENIYRGLLRSLLHPLGVPDNTLGLRPGDLVDRLKQVFEVDRDEHEYYVRDELLHRPKSLQVNITVVEGQDLSVQSTISDSHGCYCLVSIVHPTMKSRSSPSASPRHSPKMSPKIKKHSTSSMESGPGSPSGSQEWEDVLRTQTVKNNSYPQWNEEFQLAIDDFLTDEIHIFLCKSENDGGEENQGKLSPHHTHHQHHHGLRHMFRSLLHMHEHERLDNTGLGKIIIPIRDVPAMGCDWWMDLTPCGKNSKTAEGKCHLKINISHRQVDHTDEDFFSVEDYYQAAQHIYKYNLEKSLEVEGSTEASINSQDTRILDTFSISHGISQLSQTLVHVIVLLEWSSRHDEIFRTQQILNHAIQELQMVWVSKQMANISQRMPISDAEIMMYRKAASSYIGCVTDHLEDLPDLFPPSLDNVLDLQAKLGYTGTKINGRPVARGDHFCSRAHETFLLARPCGD